MSVSDSPEFHRQALWCPIEAAGHAVRRFTEDLALLDAVRSSSPSAFVCEIPARYEDPIQFLNQLAELNHDACVILVGPEIGAELVAHCLRSGAFDYLTVPVATTRLMTSLQDGLVNRQTFRAVRNLSQELAQSNELLAGEFETGEGDVRMTASIGVAHIPDFGIRSVSDWITAADSALYDAKALGRNRVVVHVSDQAVLVESSVLTSAAA